MDQAPEADRSTVTLLLTGDVMLGRGVDQVLAHPGDPTLVETYLHDAREYVALAERVSGPVPRGVPPAHPWGEALAELTSDPGSVRVVNLETAVTGRGTPWPGKQVHYRMSPANVAALTAARPDVVVLANNHVLDYGEEGLLETLAVLDDAGLRVAGAGPDDLAATRAVAVHRAAGEVLVHARCHPGAGVPPDWAATPRRPGVALLPRLDDAATAELAASVREAQRPGVVQVVSLHWGHNWQPEVPAEQRHCAHRLLEAGAAVVHGHSSHHVRPLEVHDGRLVLYGCGDFVDDYEGIGGHAAYRPDLRVLYRARVSVPDQHLVDAELVPFRPRRLRLEHAQADDVGFLADLLARTARGARVRRTPGTVLVEPA